MLLLLTDLVRGRSQTTLTRFCPLLPNYPPTWHLLRNSFTEIRENLHTVDIYSITVAVWTQKQLIPLLTCPQGSQGCQQMRQDPLNLNLEIWIINMDPKLKKLWEELSRLKEKKNQKPCFLTVFQWFCNLGSIIVHQTSKFEFSGSWPIFWHPWDPWHTDLEVVKVSKKSPLRQNGF